MSMQCNLIEVDMPSKTVSVWDQKSCNSIDNHCTHGSSALSRKYQLFYSGQQTQAGLHASNDSLRREIRAVIHDLYQLEELERSERCGRGEVKNTTGAENVV